MVSFFPGPTDDNRAPRPPRARGTGLPGAARVHDVVRRSHQRGRRGLDRIDWGAIPGETNLRGEGGPGRGAAALG